MDKLDGSDSLVLVDEPVFYLSPGAPALSLLFGLAAAVPTFHTCGYHNFLSVRLEECTALLFQITLTHTCPLVGSTFKFLFMQTHVPMCVCVCGVFACMCSSH